MGSRHLKFSRGTLILSVEQREALWRHIDYRIKEIERHLTADFQQDVERETLELLAITNEGITREDLDRSL